MAFNPSLNNQPHTPYKRRMPSVARVVEYWRTHPQMWMKSQVIG